MIALRASYLKRRTYMASFFSEVAFRIVMAHDWVYPDVITKYLILDMRIKQLHREEDAGSALEVQLMDSAEFMWSLCHDEMCVFDKAFALFTNPDDDFEVRQECIL